MINLVSIDKISNHPENPRKDLGDLTELAESIKQSGILQNLTLVPIEGKEDEFYALIGNRRLAAAKLAGLTEVPCAIVEMDKKTQIATMLLENMQRSDLTAYEQAQGFQMMMDLGETVNDISVKTGFSQTTVRNRVKLLDLDQDKLKESSERGGTLTDYIKLGQIECEKLRNEVLETVGTADFNYKFKLAIDKEKEIKDKNKAIETLSSFAEKITERTSNMTYIESFNSWHYENIEIPEDANERNYYFKDEGHYITLLAERNVDEEEQEKEEERKREMAAIEERRKKLEKISNRAYELRCEFIEGISNTKARRHMDEIIEAAIYQMGNIYGITSMWDMAKLFNIEIEEKSENEIEWKEIEEQIWKQPEKNLLALVHYSIDEKHYKYYYYSCSYKENKELDYVYRFLGKLGYKMSEEEKQLQDGTHELFVDSE